MHEFHHARTIKLATVGLSALVLVLACCVGSVLAGKHSHARGPTTTCWSGVENADINRVNGGLNDCIGCVDTCDKYVFTAKLKCNKEKGRADCGYCVKVQYYNWNATTAQYDPVGGKVELTKGSINCGNTYDLNDHVFKCQAAGTKHKA